MRPMTLRTRVVDSPDPPGPSQGPYSHCPEAGLVRSLPRTGGSAYSCQAKSVCGVEIDLPISS